MYQLTCTACKHTVEMSFARIGAQAVCRSCAHRFTVQRETVRRLVAIAEDSGNDADNPLLLGQPATKPQPPARPAAVERPAEQPAPAQPPAAEAPQVPADPDLKPIQPVVAHQEPSPDVARLIARHRARRQRRQRIVIAVVSCVLLISIMIGYIILTRFAGDKSTGDTPGVSEVTSGDIAELAIDGPVIQSARLPAVFWDEIDRSADTTYDPSSVNVSNGELTDGSDGRIIYRAQVATTGYRVIEQATMHVMLVDENNRIFAEYALPLLLLCPGAPPRSVTVTVPTVLVRRTENVMTHVTIEKEMIGGTPFEKVVYEPLSGGSYAAVRITAFNPIASTMNGAMFHIRAFNSANETVARWSVHWKQPIEGRQRVEFAALTPVKPEWNVASWEVVGAGTGSSNADAATDFDSESR